MPTFGDIIVLAVIAVIVFFVVRSLIKQSKSGGCAGSRKCSSGGCSGCGGSCHCGNHQ